MVDSDFCRYNQLNSIGWTMQSGKENVPDVDFPFVYTNRKFILDKT